MTLAVAIGNTNIRLGYYKNKLITYEYDNDNFNFETTVKFKKILIASVVPSLTSTISNKIQNTTDIIPIIINWQQIPLNVSKYDTKLVGVDRLLSCYGAYKKYGAPVIVFDFGTANSISILDKDANFIGGAILPGVSMGIKALNVGTALLPKINTIEATSVIGSDTISCITSGAIHGTASIVDGMVKKIQNELGYSCNIIATGGMALQILPHCEINKNIIHSPNLLLESMHAL